LRMRLSGHGMVTHDVRRGGACAVEEGHSRGKWDEPSTQSPSWFVSFHMTVRLHGLTGDRSKFVGS
jgi:hypothetical protein